MGLTLGKSRASTKHELHDCHVEGLQCAPSCSEPPCLSPLVLLQSNPSNVTVALVSSNGTYYATAVLTGIGNNWHKSSVELISSATDHEARVGVSAEAPLSSPLLHPIALREMLAGRSGKLPTCRIELGAL